MENKKTLLTLMFIVLVLSIGSVVYSISQMVNRPLLQYVVPVEFSVGDSLGLDLDDDVLTFGRLIPGSSYSRNVHLENSFDFPIKAYFYLSEEVQDYVSMTGFVLVMPGEKVNVPVSISIPTNLTKGNYEGMINVRIEKAVP